MELGVFDVVTFVGFLLAVVVVSLYAGRREKSGLDYFLAGRTLVWPLIGLVAASYTIYGGLKSVVWSDLLQGGDLAETVARA